MGYELHIIRREHWETLETSNISLDEWLNYVKSDKELELTNGYSIKIGSEIVFRNRPGFCEWKTDQSKKEFIPRPWLSYHKGSIDTKNPDPPTIRKMMQIAAAIGAKVQGDDGEFYTEEYLRQMKITEKQESSIRAKENKSWWKFW
jgi:hypothetical protein